MTRRPAAAQTKAFLARTSGLSGTETAAYEGLINGLVADGNFALLDCLYIFATKDTATAKLNLISNTFNLTANGSFASSGFAADTGWTGGGTSSDFLDTGFTPSTAGGKFALNSASLGVYCRTSRTNGTNMGEIGAQDTTITRVSWLINSGTASFYDMNEAGLVNPATSDAQGQWGTSRIASNLTSLYKNASSTAVTSNATASVGLTDETIYIGAVHNSNSTAGGFPSTDQLAAAFIGGGITGAQWLSISNRINAYMTALGANVYS